MTGKNSQIVDPQQFTPVNATDFQVLLVLAGEPIHGYGIMKAVEENPRTGVRLGLGSLYRIIARLTAAGLIDECPQVESVVHAGKTRRCYGLTSLGLAVLNAETERLRETLSQADAVLHRAQR